LLQGTRVPTAQLFPKNQARSSAGTVDQKGQIAQRHFRGPNKLTGLVTSRLVGNDLRAWRSFRTDYGQAGSFCSPESASRQGFIVDGKRVYEHSTHLLLLARSR